MNRPPLPNFLYIGLPKAASTWVFKLLAEHPQAFMMPAKESYYFDRYYHRGLDWYLSHFRAAAGQAVVGEVCHDYLYSPLAAQRIHETLGEVALMVCLREPVDWLFSRYLFGCRNGMRPQTFEEFLAASPQILEECRYQRLLQPFVERFGRQRLHVALFEDLQRDAAEFARRIWDFLQIDPIPLPATARGKLNPASRPRSAMVASLVKSAARMVRDWGGAEWIARVKEQPVLQRLLYRPIREQDKPQPNRDTVVRLREGLADDMAALDELLGGTISDRWRYGSALEQTSSCDTNNSQSMVSLEQ